MVIGTRDYDDLVVFRRRKEEDSSLFGVVLSGVGALAIGVGMWWLAAYIFATADGDVLVPRAEGRLAGAERRHLITV